MSKSECERYWRKLMGQMNVVLSGASDDQLRVQLYDTLEEFFDGSNCWLENIVLTVVPDTLEYPVSPLSGRILRLYSVLDQNNVPQSAMMPEIGTIRFTYPYTNSQPMVVTVVKTVTDPMLCFPPNIPDWILPTHGRGIFHGVVGSMMLQPGQSYSNPPAGTFHLQKFRDFTAHARVAMSRMNTVGTQSWAFPQQFRVGGQKGGVSTFNVHPAGLLR
jgi:hypothetical protein